MQPRKEKRSQPCLAQAPKRIGLRPVWSLSMTWSGRVRRRIGGEAPMRDGGYIADNSIWFTDEPNIWRVKPGPPGL